jgi:hypothetical protein
MGKMKPSKSRLILINYMVILITLFLVSGCSDDGSKAPDVVVEYYKALINKDYPRLISNSCATWETQAKTDYDSFAAVEARLENLSCQVVKQEEDALIVSCAGRIVANYGNEVLEIDLSKQNYRVIKESGDWRMCGYQ